ncbi:MAG: hypothetical protein GY845_03205 [Planctomycetes bacterium]|nr:hypothetical protein [Planctomycetota bacterium]
MPTIKTVSNAAGRTIEIETPAIFLAETLADIAKIQGEDLCIQHIKAQLAVSFRSMVRGLLEKKVKDADGKDTEDDVNDDEKILSMDFTGWCPTLRVVQTPEEKALKALGNLPDDVRAAVLASFEAKKKG